MSLKQTAEPNDIPQKQDGINSAEKEDRMDLSLLLRLLLREPPPGHNFDSCPICKRYGIERI